MGSLWHCHLGGGGVQLSNSILRSYFSDNPPPALTGLDHWEANYSLEISFSEVYLGVLSGSTHGKEEEKADLGGGDVGLQCGPDEDLRTPHGQL